MKLTTLIASVLLVAFLFAVTSVNAEETKAWNFREFLLDRTDYFDVQTSTTNAEQQMIKNDPEQPLRQLFFTPQDDNATGGLAGITYINDTSVSPAVITQMFNFVIDFDATKNNTGTISIKETGKKISFEFAQFNDVAIATGVWEGSVSFQLIVPGPDRFIFTLFDTQKAADKTVYVAKKVLTVQPKTFFQTYGTYIMMAAMLMFNLYTQRRQEPEESGEEAQKTKEAQGKMAAALAPAGQNAKAKAKKD